MNSYKFYYILCAIDYTVRHHWNEEFGKTHIYLGFKNWAPDLSLLKEPYYNTVSPKPW
jgi:hypothetical protein